MPRVTCPRLMGQPSWRVCFRSPRDVADAGGVFRASSVYTFTGTGLEASSATPDQVGLSYVSAANSGVISRGSLRVKFRTPSDITNTTIYVVRGDLASSAHEIGMFVTGGLCWVRLGGGNYGYFTPTADTEYDLLAVYDGSLAGYGKLVVYVNGASQALTYGGTLPASRGPVNVWYVFRDNTVSNYCRQGATIREIAWWDAVLTGGDALDLYQADTYTEVDASRSLIWLPLRSWYYDGGGIAKTQNLGTGGDATLGDGTTANTFPTFEGPHSVYGNGSTKYIKTPLTDTIEYNTPFSIVTLVRLPMVDTYDMLMSWLDLATTRGGWMYVYNLGYLALGLYTSGANLAQKRWVIPAVTYCGYASVCVTYDGTGVIAGMNGYFNGVKCTTTVNDGDNLLGGTIKTNKPIIVGGTWNGSSVAYPMLANRRAHPVMFPFELTPGQVSWLHERLMRELNSWGS